MARVRNEEGYAASRDAILQEAARLFRLYGYEKATITQIAERLGLSKASVYYYFPTKEDLLFEMCENAVGAALEQMSALQSASMTDIDRLHQLLLNHFRAFATNADAFSVFIQELWKRNDPRTRSIRRKQRRFQDGVERLIGSAQASGAFRATDPALTTFAILGMCHWAYQWMPTSKMSAEEITAGFMDLLTHGMLGNPVLRPPG